MTSKNILFEILLRKIVFILLIIEIKVFSIVCYTTVFNFNIGSLLCFFKSTDFNFPVFMDGKLCGVVNIILTYKSIVRGDTE